MIQIKEWFGKMWKRRTEGREEYPSHGRKRNLFHGVVCIGLLIMIWGGYLFATKKIEQRIDTILEDNFSWVVQVDAVETKGNKLVLSGFAFKLNQDAEKEAYSIVLHNLDTGEYFFPKMKYEERKDVNDYFLCEYDYTNSGFTATINAKKLDLKENDYEMLLRPGDTRAPSRFATYLADGNLMYVNPKEYTPLEVSGTDLEEITSGGVLRVYRPDFGMYVYQHQGELYWIAEKEYGFEDGDTYVQCHLDTTQIERLPQQRLENEWYWDNISFMFSENEINERDTGRYRVTRKAVPKEYAITKMWTGNHIDGWIWKHNFRPWYEFGR